MGRRKSKKGDPFMQGVCVALTVVRGMDCGVTWGEIVQAAGVSEFLHYVTKVEPEEWELTGCDTYVEAKLRGVYGAELDAALAERTTGDRHE